MACTGCGAELAPAAKFCSECGTPQSHVCSSCGAHLGGAAKFCAECGTPTGAASATTAPTAVGLSGQGAAEPSSLAERRGGSVIFCDLVGVYPLSEKRHPGEGRGTPPRRFETHGTE